MEPKTGSSVNEQSELNVSQNNNNDGKKKRNKKKTKMTDIDLMNNFMKSLHSHPEEDLPIPSPNLKN